jgi:hypothetical protein
MGSGPNQMERTMTRRNYVKRGGKPTTNLVHSPRPAAVESLEGRTLFDSKIGDVFYIALENHNFTQPATDISAPQQLFGNAAAPYLNSLITPGNPNAAQVSYASAYHNVLATPSGNNPSIHPSEPNYIWSEAGSNLGTTNDSDPYTTGVNNVFAGPNLTGLIQSAGISWKSYQEDIDLVSTSGSVNFPAANSLTSTVAPQSQWTVPTSSLSGTSTSYVNPYNGSNQYNFAVKHDGQLFFTDTNGGTLPAPNTSPANPETQYYAPLQQLTTDLTNNTVARYNWITPDQYNDMHTALNTNFTYNGVTYQHNTDAEQIAQGDNFLSKIIPQIMASQAYKNNGVIVIWNDETEGANANDFTHTSTEIVISPLAKGNAYNSTVDLTHSSDVKTMQEIFGVQAPNGGFLGDANTPGTNDLSDLFKPGVISPGILLLDSNASYTLTLTGGSSINAQNSGNVVVDSNNRRAVDLTGGSSITAGAIDVTGGTKATGGSSFSTTPIQTAPTADPLGLALPAAPAKQFHALSFRGRAALTLSPGTYVGGINIHDNGPVTLLPGIYYMQGGGFSISGKGAVTGTGVMIVNAPKHSWDTISFSSHTNVNLSAPTDLTGALAPYNGIVFFQDPNSWNQITIGGGSNIALTGTVYAAGAFLEINGGSTLSDKGYGGIAGLILDSLEADGGSAVTVDF